MKRAVASLLLAILVGVFTAGPAAAVNAPAIGKFTVFGLNGVVIGVKSTVVGLVGGVNDNAKTGDAIHMNGQAKIDGDAYSGGSVSFGSHATITGKLFIAALNLILHIVDIIKQIVGGPQIGPVVFPALPAPAAFACPTGGANDSGANGETRNLVPGTFGDFNFGAGFKLNFTQPGTYVFNSIKGGRGSVITSVKGVTVQVCNAFNFGSVTVQPNSLKPTDFTVETHSNDPEDAFRIGGNSTWIGNVFTPFGGIHVGSGGSKASVFGQLVAGQVVDIEHGVLVNQPNIPGNQPVKPKEATLLHSAKNENNGANNSIFVKVQVAAVIGFPFDDVLKAANAALPVQKAVLRLFVCNTPNDPAFCPDAAHAPDGIDFTPTQWPAAGDHDTAFKMDDGFERWGSGLPGTPLLNNPPEGNGNNFPKDDNPRGDHLGVTWNCVIDTNIANEAQDCKGVDFWNAGLLHQGPGTDSTTLIVNNLADGTPVDFDVTADFNAGIGPLDKTFISWFVRKVSGSGSVSYYSHEGSEAKLGPGNFNLAPTLVITP